MILSLLRYIHKKVTRLHGHFWSVSGEIQKSHGIYPFSHKKTQRTNGRDRNSSSAPWFWMCLEGDTSFLDCGSLDSCEFSRYYVNPTCILCASFVQWLREDKERHFWTKQEP
jgi:hypothetical protein